MIQLQAAGSAFYLANKSRIKAGLSLFSTVLQRFIVVNKRFKRFFFIFFHGIFIHILQIMLSLLNNDDDECVIPYDPPHIRLQMPFISSLQLLLPQFTYF